MPISSSDDLKLVRVRPEVAHIVWDHYEVGEMFRAHEAESNGHWDADWLISEIMSDDLQLWLIVKPDETIEAALVTDTKPYRNGFKTCMVIIIVGQNAKAWVHLRGDLEEWAKGEGCERIECIGRKAWKAFLPDWSPTYMLFEKALT